MLSLATDRCDVLHEEVLLLCEAVVVALGDGHPQEVAQSAVHARVRLVRLLRVELKGVCLVCGEHSGGLQLANQSGEFDVVALVEIQLYKRYMQIT
jgi:hypothetical protein